VFLHCYTFMHRIADELKNIRKSEHADDFTGVMVRRHQQAVMTADDQPVNGFIHGGALIDEFTLTGCIHDIFDFQVNCFLAQVLKGHFPQVILLQGRVDEGVAEAETVHGSVIYVTSHTLVV
jgi:hypothetical protein